MKLLSLDITIKNILKSFVNMYNISNNQQIK